MTVDQQRLAALHADGKSAREIAEILGCTPRTVVRWRSITGHTVRPAPVRVSPSVKERALQLLADGCSLAEVGRTVGVDQSTVGRWFPDAPRMSSAEVVEWARFCKANKHVIGGGK